jgi:hypothetical protein
LPSTPRAVPPALAPTSVSTAPQGAERRNAVGEVGSAAAYDLHGVSEVLYDTFCAQCQDPIVGNHIATCNGERYIAGPRQGRSCFCAGITRLYHVRPGDGAVGELQDRRGDRYVEHIAGAELTCSACEGPIHRDEAYVRQAGSTWIECGRCTIVY